MRNDILLSKVEMNCPVCGKYHAVEKHRRKTQALVKGIEVNYEELYFVCERAVSYEKIIERNTTIPAVKDLSCFLDTKTSIPTYSLEINVLQGNSNLSQNNLSLGKYLFSGIKPLSNISPQISVTFAVDATGFIDVHVKEWETNGVMHIPIKNSPKMSEDELRRLLESV
jgi:molecular chaperone DnaK (HSP70)